MERDSFAMSRILLGKATLDYLESYNIHKRLIFSDFFMLTRRKWAYKNGILALVNTLLPNMQQRQ